VRGVWEGGGGWRGEREGEGMGAGCDGVERMSEGEQVEENK